MIGRILGNRYELIEQIGEGGMAIVYKAKCHLLNRFVGVKILRDEFTHDEEFIRKFRRESQAAASLSHPNILNIYDVGEEEIGTKKVHYIVMEYINGETLKEVIKGKGKLTVDETKNYSLQIAEALQHAHQNHIVHRDIKPHNIMITNDNRVKVTDFGIARAVTSSTVTTTSNALGSVHYFSPEQARGGYTDEKSDIYSLGIVMYEMVTGKLPYEADSPISVALKHIQEEIIPPREIDPSIPLNIETIILKCVQKRQSDRYNNISDLILDLRAIKSLDGNTVLNRDLDSSTRLIPIVNIKEDDDKMMKNTNKNKNKPTNRGKKDKKSEGGGFIIFLGILLAFILVTGIFLGYSKLRNLLASEEIIVPNIVGLQEDEAKAKIEALDLVFNVTDRIKSSEFSAGEVMYQSVEENSKVKNGYPINVTISQGEDFISVPSVVNKTLSEAEEILKGFGLRVGTVDPGFSDSVPEDMVISQIPQALAGVEPGSRVNLVISEGPEVKNVIMPNLVNTPIDKAKNEIVKLGLVVGDVKPQPSNNVAKDLVTWQSYEQGTELQTKTAVDLYISSGPEGTPVEPEPGEDNPSDNSNVEVPITLTLTPFAQKEETQIRINRIQDGITELVHNKTYKASDGDIVITLYGKVGAKLDVLYDGIYQGSHTIQQP